MAPGRILAVGGMVAIIAWAATHQPPAVNPDGGFPAAQRVAQRIEASAGAGPIRLVSLPLFKPGDAYAYPLVLDGRKLLTGEPDDNEVILVRTDASAADPASLVVVCDALFEVAIGAPCGGSAEATVVPQGIGDPIERFDAAPGRTISMYRVPAP